MSRMTYRVPIKGVIHTVVLSKVFKDDRQIRVYVDGQYVDEFDVIALVAYLLENPITQE